MTNKPFTLNKKRLTLMTASAALVLTLATPMVLAAPGDEPGDDAPIDDSEEIVVPFDPEDPTAGLDDPIELPEEPEPEVGENPVPDPVTPVEPTPDEPVEGEPEDDTPIAEPTPEPDNESPGELDPVQPVIPEPEDDTGTEPVPTPVPEVEPEPEIEPEIPVVDSGDDNADAPVRVLVTYVDESGKELVPSVGLKGDVGMQYAALNVDIPGYQLMSSTGASFGVFGEDQTTVTYVYRVLGEAVTPAPTEPTPDEPGDDAPIDDSDEEVSTPIVTPVDEDVDETPAPTPTEPGDDAPIDDSDEEVVTPVTPTAPPAGDDTTPTAPVEDGMGAGGDEPADDAPIDDADETIVPIAAPGGENVTDAEKEAAKVKADAEAVENGQKDKRDAEKAEDDKAAAVALNEQDGGNAKAENGEMKAIPQASAETNWFVIAMGALATGGAAFMLYMRRLKPGASQE